MIEEKSNSQSVSQPRGSRSSSDTTRSTLKNSQNGSKTEKHLNRARKTNKPNSNGRTSEANSQKLLRPKKIVKTSVKTTVCIDSSHSNWSLFTGPKPIPFNEVVKGQSSSLSRKGDNSAKPSKNNPMPSEPKKQITKTLLPTNASHDNNIGGGNQIDRIPKQSSTSNSHPQQPPPGRRQSNGQGNFSNDRRRHSNTRNNHRGNDDNQSSESSTRRHDYNSNDNYRRSNSARGDSSRRYNNKRHNHYDQRDDSGSDFSSNSRRYRNQSFNRRGRGYDNRYYEPRKSWKTNRPYSDTNIYVTHIPTSWRDDDLRQEFQKFGEVKTQAIITPMKHVHQGVLIRRGFVDFVAKESATRAVAEMDGEVFKDGEHNVKIQVKPAYLRDQEMEAMNQKYRNRDTRRYNNSHHGNKDGMRNQQDNYCNRSRDGDFRGMHINMGNSEDSRKIMPNNVTRNIQPNENPQMEMMPPLVQNQPQATGIDAMTDKVSNWNIQQPATWKPEETRPNGMPVRPGNQSMCAMNYPQMVQHTMVNQNQPNFMFQNQHHGMIPGHSLLPPNHQVTPSNQPPAMMNGFQPVPNNIPSYQMNSNIPLQNVQQILFYPPSCDGLQSIDGSVVSGPVITPNGEWSNQFIPVDPNQMQFPPQQIPFQMQNSLQNQPFPIEGCQTQPGQKDCLGSNNRIKSLSTSNPNAQMMALNAKQNASLPNCDSHQAFIPMQNLPPNPQQQPHPQFMQMMSPGQPTYVGQPGHMNPMFMNQMQLQYQHGQQVIGAHQVPQPNGQNMAFPPQPRQIVDQKDLTMPPVQRNFHQNNQPAHDEHD